VPFQGLTRIIHERFYCNRLPGIFGENPLRPHLIEGGGSNKLGAAGGLACLPCWHRQAARLINVLFGDWPLSAWACSQDSAQAG